MQLNTVLIMGIVIALLMVNLFMAKKRVLRKSQFKQLQSIKLNLILKSLLINIQKQRGLSSGYIHNESQFEINQSLDSNERAINLLEYQYSEFLNDDPRWRSIRLDWAFIKANIFQLDSESRLKNHNLLIENIIFMIEDIAHKWQSVSKDSFRHSEISLIWANILHTLEAIGKTRFIGTGIASRGICGRENKMKLKYLSDEIIRNYKSVLLQLDQVTEEEIKIMLSELSQNIDGFLVVIQNKLIIPEIPEVSDDIFFNQATEAMEGFSQLYDALSTIKQRQISRDAA